MRHKNDYLVAFLNFKLSSISQDFRTDVALMDMVRHTMFSDKVRLVYLQLPYFTKEADDCETIFEKIIFTLKHMDILERMPWMAQNAVFQRLSEIADVASLNKDERIKYDANMKAFRDTIAVMEGQYMEGREVGRAEGLEEGLAKGRTKGLEEGLAKGRTKGLEEGLAKGRTEGLAEGIQSVAKTMKNAGKSIDEIAAMTGLDRSVIETL